MKLTLEFDFDLSPIWNKPYIRPILGGKEKKMYIKVYEDGEIKVKKKIEESELFDFLFHIFANSLKKVKAKDKVNSIRIELE